MKCATSWPELIDWSKVDLTPSSAAKVALLIGPLYRSAEAEVPNRSPTEVPNRSLPVVPNRSTEAEVRHYQAEVPNRSAEPKPKSDTIKPNHRGRAVEPHRTKPYRTEAESPRPSRRTTSNQITSHIRFILFQFNDHEEHLEFVRFGDPYNVQYQQQQHQKLLRYALHFLSSESISPPTSRFPFEKPDLPPCRIEPTRRLQTRSRNPSNTPTPLGDGTSILSLTLTLFRKLNESRAIADDQTPDFTDDPPRDSTATCWLRHNQAEAEPRYRHNQAEAEPGYRHNQAEAEPRYRHNQAEAEPGYRHNQAEAEPRYRHNQAEAEPRYRHNQAEAEPRYRHSQTEAEPYKPHYAPCIITIKTLDIMWYLMATHKTSQEKPYLLIPDVNMHPYYFLVCTHSRYALFVERPMFMDNAQLVNIGLYPGIPILCLMNIQPRDNLPQWFDHRHRPSFEVEINYASTKTMLHMLFLSSRNISDYASYEDGQCTTGPTRLDKTRVGPTRFRSTRFGLVQHTSARHRSKSYVSYPRPVLLPSVNRSVATFGHNTSSHTTHRTDCKIYIFVGFNNLFNCSNSLFEFDHSELLVSHERKRTIDATIETKRIIGDLGGGLSLSLYILSLTHLPHTYIEHHRHPSDRRIRPLSHNTNLIVGAFSGGIRPRGTF
ncbi:hypothetical protein LXL04_013466 [Taraxacum kok-saghyz]